METSDEIQFVDAAGELVDVVCPYCFETNQILIDPETVGEMVQDCEVCCHPWLLRVWRNTNGRPEVEAGVL